MKQQQTAAVGLRCPVCGKGLVFTLDRRDPAGTHACTCGAHMLDVQPGEGGKISLEMPCVMCGNTHRFTLAETVLFGEGAQQIFCPATHLDVLFAGNEKDVRTHMKGSEAFLRSIVTETLKARDEAEEEAEGENGNDVQLEALSALYALADEGGIRCGCGSENFGILPVRGSVLVRCDDCGAQQLIDCGDSRRVSLLWEADGLTLPGKKE
ncbi:MAG: hypothetical protein IKD06_06050 [Clostridia bacterium]|nr:hypothetical protein [Clostridia bacterium]